MNDDRTDDQSGELHLHSETVLDRRIAVRRLDPEQIRRNVDDLCSLLATDPDGCVRDRSAKALARGFAPGQQSLDERPDWKEAVLPALNAALQDDDYGVRIAAAESLGRLRSASSVEPLLRLVDDSSQEVVVAALDALVEIGDSVAIEALEEKRNAIGNSTTLRILDGSIELLRRKQSR